MKKITILSWNNVVSHELEVLNYFNNLNNIKIDYFISSNVDYLSSKQLEKFSNINFLNEIKINELNNIIILFNYVIDDNLLKNLDVNRYKFIYIWKKYIDSLNKSYLIKNIDTYCFFKTKEAIKYIWKKFPNAKVNNILNINYPSGIRWTINIVSEYYNKFIYDIVIILWWWLDFKLLDSIINDLWDIKILVVWKNHPNEDVLNNMDLILKWWNKKNITLLNMTNIEDFFILLKFSKLWLLPFLPNIKDNITRVSDLLYLWKIVLTTNIGGNMDVNNLIFCNWKKEFLWKINYFLEEKNYNKEIHDNISDYYQTNYSISLILDKIVENLYLESALI